MEMSVERSIDFDGLQSNFLGVKQANYLHNLISLFSIEYIVNKLTFVKIKEICFVGSKILK